MTTNIGLRKKIIKEYNKLSHIKKKGERIKIVMEKSGATYWQVYNAIEGRIKTTRSPRSDKGSSRATTGEETLSDKPIDDFQNPEDFLEHQFMVCLKDLATRKLHVETRVKLLKDITAMQKNLEARKMEMFIRKPEARLIIRIMKRLNPKLDEENIKKIYAEEYEKLQRELA